MGVWQSISIGGKNADLFTPTRAAAQASAVLFLHGHGLITLRDNAAYSEQLERFGLSCVCPHGRRSWWGTRICREFDSEMSPLQYLREQVVPWVGTQLHVAPPQIGLLGVSMGGQGALKLAYLHPSEFPVVVALAPAIDFHNWHGRGLPLDDMYESAEAARQDTVTLHIHPLNWPRHQFLLCDPEDHEWLDGVERLASKLSSTGIPFELDVSTSHGGHSWKYFDHLAPRVMSYIHERLESESKRLPIVRAAPRIE
jgi:pimeloyl-ACP methyl ester carboxylesterase